MEVPVEDMAELDGPPPLEGPVTPDPDLDAAERHRHAGGDDGRGRRHPADRRSGPRSRNGCWSWSGQHRSTIVFANSRRLAERLTARLNELAAEQPVYPVDVGRFPAEAIGQSGWAAGVETPAVARAHHGSMSREQRTAVEEELKSGRLPCVVATSSLELGIDMGAVDLVVQVEAPPSVASGLQRVGRAGHQVGAVSRGVMFPKFRGDLVSCAVVAERMGDGAIEAVRYPRNPLDVLAQHIVAMVALEPWTVTELAALVRRAAPFAALPESALHAVLDMLAGRYPTRGVRRAAAADHLGPDQRRAARAAGRAAARGHLRRHDPRPRPVHRDDAGVGGRARLPRRRAGRGDGLRVARRRHVPAGHVVVADRGHHARPGDRGARAGPAGADAVLEGRRAGPSAGTRPGAGQVPPRSVQHGGAGGAGAGRPRPGWTSGRRTTCSRTWPSRRRRRGTSRTTGRCWWSGSATSWATGGSSCTRRSARRSTRRGRWRSPRGCGSGAGSRRRSRTPTTASCCGCRTRSTTRARR